MAGRRTFFSFHFKPDSWRAAQVRGMGTLEGNVPVSDNHWETISKSDAAIKSWILDQLKGRSCTVVLIGSNTANRPYINFEIISSWDSNKGVVCIYIHKLKDDSGSSSTKGDNPFDFITLGTGGPKLSTVVKAYNPPGDTSAAVYEYIKEHIADWVEEAITIRNAH